MDQAERDRIYREEQERRGHSTQPAEKPGNGMAVAALVLGLLAALFGLIPILFFFAFPLGVFGIVFGFAGYRKAKRGASGKGMSIAGLLLGILGFGLAIAGIVIVDDAVNEFGEDMEEIGEEFEQDMDELDQQLQEDLQGSDG